MSPAGHVQSLERQLEQCRFELNHRLAQLEALYQAGLVLAASLAAEELQADFLRLTVGTVDARRGFLLLASVPEVELDLVESISYDAQHVSHLRSPALRQAMDRARRAQEPVALGAGDLPAGFPGSQVLIVPVGHDGCLGVVDKETRAGVGAFTEMDTHLLSMLSQQAGMVLANARLFRGMEEERNLTASILDSVEDGVVSTDLDGRIVRLNPVAARILGFTGDALHGRDLAAVLREAGCARLAEAVRATLADGRSRQVEQERLATTTAIVDARVTRLRESRPRLGGAVVALEDLTDRFRLETMFKQYASDQVVDMLLAHGHLPCLGGETCQATVMFVDTVGSTELLGRIGATEMVTLLNDCFTRLVEVVLDHGGTLDKYTGDGFMAVFGAPLAREDDTPRAVRCALCILEEMARADGGSHRLHIKVGLSRGQVVAGNVGSPRRMEYSVIGPDVVLASRLSDLASAGQILVSSHVRAELDDAFGCQHLGRHIFKGMRESMDVYRIYPTGAAGAYTAATEIESEAPVALDVPMDTDMEIVVGQTAQAVGERLGMAADAIDEICAALVEACINAFEHSKSKSGRLRIEFVPAADSLTVVVTDQGHGFDVEQALARVRQRHERGEQRRGWGLELIGEFMDDVHIESGPAGTTLTLIKRRDPANPARSDIHG